MQGVQGLRFSPDGRFLAASVSGGACVWNTRTGRLAGPKTISGHGVSPRLEFSLDSRLLVIISGRYAELWDISAEHPEQLPLRVRADDGLVAFPGARYLATANGKPLLLWDTANLAAGPHELSKDGRPYSGNATFSADGSILAADTIGEGVYFWDTASHELTRRRIKGKFSSIDRIRFTPDGRFVATMERGREYYPSVSSNITLWDMSGGRRPKSWVVVEKPAGRKPTPYHARSALLSDSRVLAVTPWGNPGGKSTCGTFRAAGRSARSRHRPAAVSRR